MYEIIIFNYRKDKFYLTEKGKLVAVKPTASYLDGTDKYGRYEFDSPLGKLTRKGTPTLYSSPKHYAQCLAGEAEPLSNERIDGCSLWANAGYHAFVSYDGSPILKCWGRSGDEIREYKVYSHTIMVDEDGIHLNPELYKGTFKSEKDALAHALGNVEVVDFDGTTTGLGAERKIEEKTIDVKLKVFEEK